MASRKLNTNIRQEQIAKATLDLVAAGGLSALSVAAVARRIGVVPSALYRHFKSKEEILDAAMALVHEKLMGNAAVVRDETDDPMDQLHRLLMRHARLIRENRGIPQVIFSQDFYAAHPERRGRVYGGIREYLAQVAQIIRCGQQSGRIGRKIDPDAAAVMFLGLIQPSAILWHLSDGDFDVARQADRAWPLYRRAIEDGAGASDSKGKPLTRRKGA